MDAEIVILPDPDGVAHEAARRIVALSREAAESRGRFSIALSGLSQSDGGLARLGKKVRKESM